MSTPPPDRSPDRITPGKSLEPVDIPPSSKPTGGFSSHMEGGVKTPPSASTPQTGGPTPMDLSKGGTPLRATPTMDSVISQSKTMQDSLGNVESKLQEKNLKLRRSQAHLLKNKLSNAQESLQATQQKLGLPPSEKNVRSGASPVERFLSYVNDGQAQLVQIQEKLKDLASSGQELRPGDLMYIQVKMSTAQQEIEYSSILLSKVIESIKTLMNIQL